MKKFFATLSYIFIITSFVFPEDIHPKFTISKNDLMKILIDEPEETKKEILESSYNFLELIDKVLQSEDSLLQLVDKKHRLTNKDIPQDIINLTEYNLHTRYKHMPFSEKTVEDFVKMSEDALKDGIDLFIASTYRSYEFQDQIFENMKDYHGEEKAATIVAYPGASQHQLGTAVDFGTIKPSYANTEAGEWLLINSWKYGFTISYPKGMEHITTYMWEPWHYRYIGKNSSIIQRTYFDNIQHYFLIFWNKYSDFFKNNHIK